MHFSPIGCFSVGFFFLFAQPLQAEPMNLFPNGEVENEFVNQITVGPGFTTSIQSRETDYPTFWRLTPGAVMTPEEWHRGEHSIRLEGQSKEVSATVFSDFWRVKDPAMPFGLPLLPDREVTVSFYYKTSPNLSEGSLSADIVLGTIAGGESEKQVLALEPSLDWRVVTASFLPNELLWGAEIVFKLDAEAGSESVAWIDSVEIAQELEDFPNLVHNSSFEKVYPDSGYPEHWIPPVEDQWVSWVGAQYRPPILDTSTSKSGSTSLRATVTYADISGISQVVRLDQETPHPIVFGVWSKLNNSIGKAPPRYYGPDNLANVTLFVYHQDGTMQEVSPTFSLGESDHDWDYRRGGFLPERPVEKVRLQITLVGTEPTTSLWVDQVEVFEIPFGTEEPLPSAKTAPNRELTAPWGGPDRMRTDRVSAVHDGERLTLSLPKRSDASEIRVYLNPGLASQVVNHHRYSFQAIRLREWGPLEIGEVVEKQGYIAAGEWSNGEDHGLSLTQKETHLLLTIPFKAVSIGDPPRTAIGFNVEWRGSNGSEFWTGRACNTDQMGSLFLGAQPGVHIQSLRFGNRYDIETDQSQDFVTHPPLYAGRNIADLAMTNEGMGGEVQIAAGVHGPVPFQGIYEMAQGEEKIVSFPYDTEGDGLTEFHLRIQREGDPPIETSFPLSIPPVLEVVLDQEYYFAEETEATAEVHIHRHPLPEEGVLTLRIDDLLEGRSVFEISNVIDGPVVSLHFPLGSYRIGDLPVQDYQAVLVLSSKEGATLGTASARFGRIHRTRRHPLPPIEKISVDSEGRMLINDDFRFFPIIPSLATADWNEAIELGANVFRGYYPSRKKGDDKDLDIFDEVDRVWGLGAYSLPVGPGPGQLEEFEGDAEKLFSHPGFLGCYGKQFYYWNRSEDLIDYRNRLEEIYTEKKSQRLLVWGHHDSSFLYDHDLPPWPERDFPVGYCYVKIMGRPGSGWRNVPFLTLTEQVLNPKRFKLAEVNWYVSWHDDEIVPEHYKTYYSIRADSIQGMRNEAYLSVIYGAGGLYQYLCHQKGDLQRLRGWFQELNFMWPVFAGDDSKIQVSVDPPDSMIETRLKEWEGKWYLLTANAGESSQTAEIQIEGIEGAMIRKLFDLPGSPAVSSGKLSDTWRQDDAFVYEITPLIPGSKP